MAALGHQLLQITRRGDVPLIINDYPEIAAAIGAEGVHVGQDDVPVEGVRRVVGENRIVGKSTHSVEQARQAAAERVDYIGFGPLFATPTKPEYPAIGMDDIATVHSELSLPIFCIGGIKKENLATVVAHGARRAVIVSGWLLSDDPAATVAECQSLLASSSESKPD